MLASLTVAPHPLLCLGALAAEFPTSLGGVDVALPVPPSMAAPPSLPPPDDALRGRVRDVLRHAGFKPTGRSKPSSEYLLRAAEEGKWPSINAAVDIGNVVSLRSGVPISVVDLDRVRPPLRVAIAPSGTEFVFNASGQVIDVGGLIGLADADGPCANAVKDAQRSKTDASTRRVVLLLWGHRDDRARVEAASAWAEALLVQAGGRVESVAQTAEATS